MNNINGVPVYATNVVCSMLGVSMSSSLVTERTGVKPFVLTNNAVYWRQADMRDIALGLAKHLIDMARTFD